MANHTSAIEREPHVTTTRTTTISAALRRRARLLITDRAIGAEDRALIRYGLEVNDPCLAELVGRIEAGESIVDALEASVRGEPGADNADEDKIETLARLICRPGDEPETKSAALFVLMATLEHSSDARPLANIAKHFAFSRCGELNLYGMIEAQFAIVEAELLTSNTLAS